MRSARQSILLAAAFAAMAAGAVGPDVLTPRREAPQPKPRDDAERIAKATGKRARKAEKRARQLARATQEAQR